MHPHIRIEEFSVQEKEKLVAILRKKLVVMSSVYCIVIAASISTMIYFNRYSTVYYIENNLEVINVTCVIIAAFCGRILVAEIMDYRKETSASERKIAEAVISARQGNKMVIGNKHFSKHDFILDNSEFDSVQAGDKVRIELSIKSDMLFSIKKI